MYKRILCFFMAVALAFCAASCSSSGDKIADSGSIKGYGRNFSAANRELPDFDVNQEGDFTILQFSDTHLFSSDHKKDNKTLSDMAYALSSVKPDLAVILGDMIDGKNDKKYYNKKAAIRAVAQLFENASVYWAYVPGNNDGEYQGDNNDVLAVLAEYPHCLFSRDSSIKSSNSGTSVSYKINLRKGDKIVHSLIFLDSGAKTNGKYDAFKDEEVAWLSTTLDSTDNPASIFFHMNSNMFSHLGTQGEPYGDDYAAVEDEIEPIDGNGDIDDAVSSYGNNKVGLVSIGHLHPKTNECSYYNGIYYHITQPSGYAKSKHPAASLVTIHTEAQTTRLMYDFSTVSFDVDDK